MEDEDEPRCIWDPWNCPGWKPEVTLGPFLTFTLPYLIGNITITYRFSFLNIKPASIYPLAVCPSSTARTTLKASDLVTLPTLVALPLSLLFTTELSWYNTFQAPSNHRPRVYDTSVSAAPLVILSQLISHEAFSVCCAVLVQILAFVYPLSLEPKLFPPAIQAQLSSAFTLSSSPRSLCRTFLIFTQWEFPQRTFPEHSWPAQSPLLSALRAPSTSTFLLKHYQRWSFCDLYLCDYWSLFLSLDSDLHEGRRHACSQLHTQQFMSGWLVLVMWIVTEWTNADLGKFQKFLRWRTGRTLDILQARRKHF